MKVSIRGKNIEITEAIRNKVEKQLAKLDKYFVIGKDAEAKVLVRTYDHGQKIEVTIPSEFVILRAEVMEDDLYDAIDEVVEKLESQIRKQKTKLSRRKNQPFVLASIPDKEEEQDEVVRTKSIIPTPMDLDEAIMQMELLGHSFYVYRDIETNNISVVYKRYDGGYGLIETE